MFFKTFSRYFLLTTFGVFCILNLVDQQDKIAPLIQKTHFRITALQEKKIPTQQFEETVSKLTDSVYDPFNSFFFWRFRVLKRDIEDLHDQVSLRYANAVYTQQKQEKIAYYQSKGIPNPVLNRHKQIVIDTFLQRLYAYEDNISIFEFPVGMVSGKRGYETVKGEFAVYAKNTPYRMLSPFTSEFYDSTVSYWLPFYKDYGIHDAYWRSEYGNLNYEEKGTHGCVNVPRSEMERLFNWAEIGTTVSIN